MLMAICETYDAPPVETCNHRRAGIAPRIRVARLSPGTAAAQGFAYVTIAAPSREARQSG